MKRYRSMKKNGIGIVLVCGVVCLLIILSGCPMPSELQEYSITFDTDDGTSIIAQSVQENEKAARPGANPTKTGYAFDDWYAEDTFVTVWDFTTPITENKTLYAKWNVAYTVTFDTAGGSSIIAQSVQENTPATKPTSDPTKAGYAFDDWYVDDTFSTKWDFTTPITENTTLYAKWTVANTGTLDTDGGS